MAIISKYLSYLFLVLVLNASTSFHIASQPIWASESIKESYVANIQGDANCGAIANGSKIVSVSFPRAAFVSKRSLQEVLSDLEFFELRDIGMAPFPSLIRPTGGFETRCKTMGTALLPGTVIDLGANLQCSLVHKKPNVKIGNVSTTQTWIIDKKTLMPEKYSLATNIGGFVSPDFSKSIRWKEIAESWVSVEIFQTRMLPYGTRGGQDRFKSVVFARLHWFSINKPLTDELFDVDICSDVRRVRLLLDPEKTGATNLLDTPKSSQMTKER